VKRILLGSAESNSGSEPVTISSLSSSGCEICKTVHSFDETIDRLWIGAVGPLPISRCEFSGSRAALAFKQPLPIAILAHFTGR
jgi:hypothetical protein